MSLPGDEAEKKVVEFNLKEIPNSLTDDRIKEIVELTEGFSGRDVLTLVGHAFFEPKRKCQNSNSSLRKFLRKTEVDGIIPLVHQMSLRLSK